MKSTSSTFASHLFTGDIAGQIVNYRVLRMEDSVFIYIGKKDEEVLDGLAVGLLSPYQDREAVTTSILESVDSFDIAQKLTVRLNKPVFVSCNINFDRITAPLIETQLIQEIKERPEYF